MVTYHSLCFIHRAVIEKWAWPLACVPGLGMENIGGIFVVLICGLIIAVFVAVMEFVWSTRRTAETDEVNLRQDAFVRPGANRRREVRILLFMSTWIRCQYAQLLSLA